MEYYVSRDYFLVKIDSSGNLIWQKKLGGTDNDFAVMAHQTEDNGYIVAGMAYSINIDIPEITTKNIWIVKLKSDNLDVNDIIKPEKIIVSPNPAKDKIYIESVDEIQSLRIFDVIGKLIKTNLKNNNYIIVSDLPKGTYFLEITTDKGTYSEKIIKN